METPTEKKASWMCKESPREEPMCRAWGHKRRSLEMYANKWEFILRKEADSVWCKQPHKSNKPGPRLGEEASPWLVAIYVKSVSLKPHGVWTQRTYVHVIEVWSDLGVEAVVENQRACVIKEQRAIKKNHCLQRQWLVDESMEETTQENQQHRGVRWSPLILLIAMRRGMFCLLRTWKEGVFREHYCSWQRGRVIRERVLWVRSVIELFFARRPYFIFEPQSPLKKSRILWIERQSMGPVWCVRVVVLRRFQIWEQNKATS